jgi:hypothetical protein
MNRYYKLLFTVFLSGCLTIPDGALRMNSTSLQTRQMQTRYFETKDESSIIEACAGLIQDLGFTLKDSEPNLGMLLGEKKRSAASGGQIAVAVAIVLLGGSAIATDHEQLMRLSITTRPSKGRIAVRATFQRIVWNTNRQITKQELVANDDLYREFFAKLSKSIFLEAHAF